ncbi:hypothetical protein I4100191B2_27260 [Clostridiales bacterium]
MPPAGPETGAVPFPQQKVRGAPEASEIGWHHEAFRALVPIMGGERVFYS